MRKLVPRLTMHALDEPGALIYCELSEALEKNITVHEFAKRHVENFGFSFELDESLCEHDLTHLIAGLAQLKTGEPLAPWQHSHNGNWHVENYIFYYHLSTLTQYIETGQEWTPNFNEFYQDCFSGDIFASFRERHNATTKAAWFLSDVSNPPISIFDVRHKFHFDTQPLLDAATQHILRHMLNLSNLTPSFENAASSAHSEHFIDPFTHEFDTRCSGQDYTQNRFREKIVEFFTYDASPFYRAAAASNLQLPRDGDINRYGELYFDYAPPSKANARTIYNAIMPALTQVRAVLKEKGIHMIEPREDRRIVATEIINGMNVQQLWHFIPEGACPVIKLRDPGVTSSADLSL